VNVSNAGAQDHIGEGEVTLAQLPHDDVRPLGHLQGTGLGHGHSFIESVWP
jgi:hypothetical protein